MLSVAIVGAAAGEDLRRALALYITACEVIARVPTAAVAVRYLGEAPGAVDAVLPWAEFDGPAGYDAVVAVGPVEVGVEPGGEAIGIGPVWATVPDGREGEPDPLVLLSRWLDSTSVDLRMAYIGAAGPKMAEALRAWLAPDERSHEAWADRRLGDLSALDVAAAVVGAALSSPADAATTVGSSGPRAAAPAVVAGYAGGAAAPQAAAVDAIYDAVAQGLRSLAGSAPPGESHLVPAADAEGWRRAYEALATRYLVDRANLAARTQGAATERQGQLAQLEFRAQRAEERVAELEAQLAAVDQLITMRLLRPARDAYGRLRRLGR